MASTNGIPGNATGPSQAALKRNQELAQVDPTKVFNFQGLTDPRQERLVRQALGTLQGTSGNSNIDSLAKSDPLAQALSNQVKAAAANAGSSKAGNTSGLPKKLDVKFAALPEGGHGLTQFTTKNGKIDTAHITLDPRRVFAGKTDKEKMVSFVDTYFNELATVNGLDATDPNNNTRRHELATFEHGDFGGAVLAKLQQGQKPSDLKANDIDTLGIRLRGATNAYLVNTVPDYVKKPVGSDDHTADKLVQEGFLPAKYRDVVDANHGQGRQTTPAEQKGSTLNLFA